VAGVDGCQGRWLAAVVRLSDSAVQWRVLDTAAQVVGLLDDVRRVAVDMPIGLPERGPRSCDTQARARLGGRGSSVFPAPTRWMAQAFTAGTSYADVVTLARGQVPPQPAPTLQAWHLLPRIVDLDATLDADLAEHVTEAHPEVAFRELDGRVSARKALALGVAQRVRALQRWLDPVAALEALPAGVPAHDALDALACAWSAARWLDGGVVVLGDPAERDARGLPMLIRA